MRVAYRAAKVSISRMRRFPLWLLVLTAGCVHPVTRVVTDSVPPHHGHEFESLAVAALLVLVLIPVLAKGK